MRRAILAVLAAMFVVALTFTGLAENKVTLRLAWWGNPTRDARTLKVIEMYMAKNPNIIIQPEYTAWAGYWDKTATQAAANNLPDIMQQDYAYLLQYVGKGLMMDLTVPVGRKQLDLTSVDPTFTSGGRIKHRYYGVSLGTNAMGIGYDPGVLQKAGLAAPAPDWSWADLEKMATEVFNKTGVKTIPFGTTDPRPIFENWIRQTGKSFFNIKDGTSLGFTDQKPMIDYFDMQVRLLKAGVLVKPDVAFLTVTADEGSFAKNQCWFDFLWSNQVVMQANANKRPIGVALMPKIVNSKRPGTYLKPSMFFSITKSSTNKNEAVKFLNYFLNDIEANKVLLAERGIPIVPAVREAVKDMVDPVSKQVFDFIAMVGKGNASPIDPPDPPGTGEVLKLIRTALQEVLYGTLSSKDAAAKFMKEANAVLAKNKVQ